MPRKPKEPDFKKVLLYSLLNMRKPNGQRAVDKKTADSIKRNIK